MENKYEVGQVIRLVYKQDKFDTDFYALITKIDKKSVHIKFLKGKRDSYFINCTQFGKGCQVENIGGITIIDTLNNDVVKILYGA